MKNEVCGEFPDFCYRAYNCQEHVEMFLNGILRMGCIRSYAHIDDNSRRDLTEGHGHTKEPGIVHVFGVSTNPAEKIIWYTEEGFPEPQSEYGNSIFCFCMCLPTVDLKHMSNAFGEFIIKINDPRRLAEDINDYLFSKSQKFIIKGCNVVYNKGQQLTRKLSDNERLDLAYYQKPENFSPDCEFRIVAIKLGDPCIAECKYLDEQFDKAAECEYMKIDLGKKLDYLSVVNL